MADDAYDLIARPVMQELAEVVRTVKNMPIQRVRQRRRYPIIGGGLSDSDTLGCCGPCVDCEWMTVLGFFDEQYYLKSLPASLIPSGDPRVIVTYIGLDDSDHPYWESDSFDIECDEGTDSYVWRMDLPDVDGTGDCPAEGSENVRVYLVRDGSAAVCDDLTVPNCTDACTGGGGAGCPCDNTVTFSVNDPFHGANLLTLDYIAACDWEWTGTFTDEVGEGFCNGSVIFNAKTGTLTFYLTTDAHGATSGIYTIRSSVLCGGSFAVDLTGGDQNGASYASSLSVSGS